VARSDGEALGGGWFDYEGWQIESDDARAVQFASAHESHHKQLSDSTIWGALTRVLLRFPDISRATPFNRAAAAPQEAFATWGPMASLDWSVEDVAATYPDYVKHWQAMDRAIGTIPAVYLALHAAHAVARSCLQPPITDIVLDVGLATITIGDLPRRLRPDHRFAVLQRHPVDWAVTRAQIDAEVTDDRWPALREAPTLTAEMFATALEPVWSAVNEIVYAACTQRLAEHGCATLPNEGHRAEIGLLLDAARPLGVALDLSAAAKPAVSGTLLALANAECETYSTGVRLPGRLLPADVSIEELVTGPVSEHLMLSIRSGPATVDAFDFGGGPEPDRAVAAAYLRRGEEHEGGLRIVLRPAEDVMTADLESVASPAYAMVDMSLFTEQSRRRWQDLLSPKRAALVLDVSLAVHLPIWLMAEQSAFRYTFMRTEVQGRVVGFLLAEVATDDAPSHLLIRGLSHAAVGVCRAAFEELAASGLAVVADDTVARRHEPLLGIVVAHLAIEERVFGIGIDR
jgi:hypothetical protein